MDFRSAPCTFLGYSPLHHGYRCLDTSTDRIYIARHVRFNENVFPFKRPPPPSTTPAATYVSSLPSFIPDPTSTTTIDDSPPTTPPASPITTPLAASPPITTETTSTKSFNTSPDATPPPPPRTRPPHLRPNPKRTTPYSPSAYHATPSNTEPTSFSVASKSQEWRNAMSKEYTALIKNGTWTLVPPVPHVNIIDSKWVYKLKRDPEGNISRYKARLVAKGFKQQAGVDYHETFSPVIKATTIRVVLSLAVTHKWSIRQLDVQNAFFHGDLKETVYIRQPQGFVDPSKPGHVCLLHKSLYGLKQAPRAWFQRLSTVLHRFGFSGSRTDPSLFILKTGRTRIYILVYVDDIIITGNDDAMIAHLIQHLGSTFSIKDLGQLHYFLGIEVVSRNSNLILSQRKYILDILHRSGLKDANRSNLQ